MPYIIGQDDRPRFIEPKVEIVIPPEAQKAASEAVKKGLFDGLVPVVLLTALLWKL